MSDQKRLDSRRRIRAALLALKFVLAPSIALAQTTAPSALRRVTKSIELDGRDVGRRFDGLGAVSAGASTRLLFDYPEPQRSQILDYLFKPHYGANITVLKVEIGGDMNSTDGSEPSHMRTRDDLNGTRGYEWWLMREAKKRNPDIVLACLGWGAPGWIEGGYWSQDNLDYTIKWLDLAKQSGFKIDYAGGWNESGYDEAWYIKLDAALKAKHPDVKIIGADDLPKFNWRVATSMRKNPAFGEAVDVLGQHSPGGWRAEHEKYAITEDALATGKPLWVSEQSAQGRHTGAAPWARGLNRAYIDAQITSSSCWPPVCAWYGNLHIADTGLISAMWPWSGYYEVGDTMWAFAHTGQFAQPGWHYLNGGSAFLENGASYVTMKSPDGGDYSIIVETMDLAAPADVAIKVGGGLSDKPLNVWTTDLASKRPEDRFANQPAITAKDGVFTLHIEPRRIYSLTTTTGQSKGDAKPPSSAFETMALPSVEDFDKYEAGKLARYFSDLNGGFETVPAGGGRGGMAYRQMVPKQPLVWTIAGPSEMAPMTIFGDPRWWGDYEVSADVFLESSGNVEIAGRISSQRGLKTAGYHLRVGDSGEWSLLSQELAAIKEQPDVLASGKCEIKLNTWHTIALRMKGDRIDVAIDGAVVGGANDARHTIGNAALIVDGWHAAQFDNVGVTAAGPAPTFAEHVIAVATSEHAANFRGYDFPAANAVDGRLETAWCSEWEPLAPLPQSITLDLGEATTVHGLTYTPQLKGETRGIVTRYAVHLSDDGKTFRKVSEGDWPLGTATHYATWPGASARYVRLEALASGGGYAAASEIRVATSPLIAR